MPVMQLYKNTPAYKVLCADVSHGTVGHAYLLVHGDGKMLRDVLKLFAKAFFDAENGSKRAARIERETFTDCIMVPAAARAVSVEDVDAIVADSALRPMEGDKKLYVIEAGAQMSAQAQNKLLKTLEEPPEGVHLLIGVTNDSFLLSTVKSRVRRLEISPFSPQSLCEALGQECADGERLKIAAAESGGYLSRARDAYHSDLYGGIVELACEVLTQMKTSRDVLLFAAKIAKTEAQSEFLSILKLMLRDVLCLLQGRPLFFENKRALLAEASHGFTEGAVLDAVQKINEAEYAAVYNANAVMQTDSVLFAILEGKYRWQKS